MSKISIIIPVYNGKKYLDRCFNSILKQTFKDYEIIAIDDESTDNSYEILKKYQKKHIKIFKCYSHKNVGQAKTRNEGVKYATSEYITFIDQDDTISSDFLEKLYSNIDDNDIVVSGYNRVDEKGYEKNNIPINTSWSLYKYCATWGKLYKKSFFIKSKLQFGDFAGEDVYLFINAIALTNKIKIIEYAGYNNYINNESITHIINNKKKTRSKIMPLLQKIENSKFKNNLNQDDLLYFYLKSISLHIFTQRTILNQKELYDEYEYYFDWLSAAYSKRNRKMKCRNMVGEEGHVTFFTNCFVRARKCHLVKLWLFMVSKINNGAMK